MTPKEKANELYYKFSNILWDSDNIIESALITIDYILNSEPKKAYFIKGTWITPEMYWKEVKEEIEKL